MRVAVVGASGFVGSAVTSHLERLGHEVRALQAPRLSHDVPDVDAVLSHAHALRLQETLDLRGVDSVVNCAGLAAATSADVSPLLGANALLPVGIALAATHHRIQRVVHVSSAAVQGRSAVLNETSNVSPASLYGESKALGELALGRLDDESVKIIRPTSVHGPTRGVTRRLIRLAHSRLSFVAAPGADPTPQVHINSVARAIALLVDPATDPPRICLQPWEGFTTTSFLKTLAPDSRVRALPRPLALGLTRASALAGDRVAMIAGHSRRLEMMLLGQRQEQGWLADTCPQLTRPDPAWRKISASRGSPS